MLRALVLALAWFAALNAVASFAAWLLSRTLSPARVSSRPGALLALRLMPAALSMVFVAAIFLPAHWRFEPRGLDESFGFGIYALSALGLMLVLRSVGRLASVARAGWQLRACDGLPRIDSLANGTEVFEVHGLAGVSLAGVVRPRILVGPDVREALTPAELEAAVAHELAHQAAGDNVKRCAMYCAPDFFGQSRAAQSIEQQWRAAAECQADAHAVRGDGSRAVNLASALIKVARLATVAPAPWSSPAWSALHEAPLLETRVKRLITGSAPVANASGANWAAFIGAGAVGLVATWALAADDVHQVTEMLAHLIP